MTFAVYNLVAEQKHVLEQLYFAEVMWYTIRN